MALLGIIRCWHIRDQIPFREIARLLAISRNTVRRYLRSEVTESAYAERQTTNAIDKCQLQLSSWLKTEAGKNRKQRRSLKQLHLDLKELGFDGSYDRVAAFARKWRGIKLIGSNQLANEHGKEKKDQTSLNLTLKRHLKRVGQNLIQIAGS